jgi:hypothetical protein
VVPYPSDDQMDDNRLLQYKNGYVIEQADFNETYHYMPPDNPYHNGPPRPPPDEPLAYHTELGPFGPPPTQLHRSRLGTRDHPAWLSRGAREKIQHYHMSQLHELQDTIGRLRQAMMMERGSSPLALPPPPRNQ